VPSGGEGDTICNWKDKLSNIIPVLEHSMLLSLLLALHVVAIVGLGHPFGVMGSSELLEASLLGSSSLVSKSGTLGLGDKVSFGSYSLSEPVLDLLHGDELSLQGRILCFGGSSLYRHSGSDSALEHLDSYSSFVDLVLLSGMSS
jgi:hypothetical protein